MSKTVIGFQLGIAPASTRGYRHLNLFDIYKGKQVEKGNISMAVNLTFQDKERTLTDEIVDKQIESILKILDERLGVKLRDK